VQGDVYFAGALREAQADVTGAVGSEFECQGFERRGGLRFLQWDFL
jgi:hypothetical protein